MAVVDHTLVLAFGFRECFDFTQCEHEYYPGVYEYNLKSHLGVWSKYEPAVGQAWPTPRAFFGMTSYDKGDSVLVYGGVYYNAAFSFYDFSDELWEYFPRTHTWTKRVATNAGPGKRSGAMIVVKGHTMYLSAGLDSDYPTYSFTTHNDLWSFDLQTNTWSVVVADNTPGAPPIRYLHKFELEGDKLYLYGGNINPSILGVQNRDFWSYDISSNTWTEYEVPEEIRSRVHAASAINKELFVVTLGDVNDDVHECKVNEISGGQNPVDETHVYKFKGNRWERGWNPFVSVQNAPRLKRPAHATYKDKLYITNGFDYFCPANGGGDYTGPVWNTQLFALDLKKL